jgi:hypothetical protein
MKVGNVKVTTFGELNILKKIKMGCRSTSF